VHSIHRAPLPQANFPHPHAESIEHRRLGAIGLEVSLTLERSSDGWEMFEGVVGAAVSSSMKDRELRLAPHRHGKGVHEGKVARRREICGMKDG
jgi:hypothetical protein